MGLECVDSRPGLSGCFLAAGCLDVGSLLGLSYRINFDL